jgi:hypothetical protein
MESVAIIQLSSTSFVLFPRGLRRAACVAQLFVLAFAGVAGAEPIDARVPAEERPDEETIEDAADDDTLANEPQERPTTAFGLLTPIPWNTNHRRVGWFDYTATLLGATTSIVARLVGPREGGPTSTSSLDENVRGALRPSSFRQRLLAQDFSDVLLGISSTYALAGDPLINAAWLRNSPETGYQIAWMNAEVIAVTLGLQQLTANLIGRERPYGRTCGTDELDERTHRCEGSDRYRSLFSGHTSVPFAVAAATCIHHVALPLSGGHAWVPCTLGYATAAASGSLRIVSDNHYASDVLAGAAVGTVIGFTIPLVHYMTGTRTLELETRGTRWLVFPQFATNHGRPLVGLTLWGTMR